MITHTTAESSSSGFVLRFLGDAGGRLAEQKVPLANARNLRIERVGPVREFPTYPWAAKLPGAVVVINDS